MQRLTLGLALLSLVALHPAVYGQQPANPTQTQIQKSGIDNPIYKITINVVERSTKAINYRHRSGATPIDFRGTPLLPDSRGEAKVESKQGYIEIEVEFDKLQPATRFGPEYLTYVMWAITPEGRATNLGEVLLNGTKSKLNVTTELQAFGLVVTAEPYFAVTQPSDVVVMENTIRKDTEGKVEEVDAKYELLQRGQYTVNVPPTELKPISLDPQTPLELHEARNALRIARWAGADTSSTDTFQKASALLKQAEDYKTRKAGQKSIVMTAREAVQTAEDARLIALKRQADQRSALEKQAAADREARALADTQRARAAADDEARKRAQAETDQRIEAEKRARAEAETDRARLETQLAAERSARERDAIQADAERARKAAAEQAEKDQQALKAQSEREQQALKAQAESDQQALKAQAERDQQALKAEAERDQQALKAEANKSAKAAEQAQREKAELRQQLIQQFSLILETRDSARGLIVNMSDVLFDTAQSTLKPGAREKLAKVAGVILSHPGLKLEIEGHTDSVGTDEYNQVLSEKRAESAKDFLIKQGISQGAITSTGFGELKPVASNDNAAGRQVNRRVELVVSGEIIGITVVANQ